MNTRAKVLVRDSEVDVTFRGTKRCVVEQGEWHDPYADSDVTTSKQIQIDHMVPLKNAYDNGAWQWDYKTRCLYANFLGYHDHLVSAGAHENMSKGDSGPEGYLPPNLSYRCQYIKNWMMIKLVWRLRMTPDEAQALHETAYNYNCPSSLFQVTSDELATVRQFIANNLNYCMINAR
jgi:hypothetical protein